MIKMAMSVLWRQSIENLNTVSGNRTGGNNGGSTRRISNGNAQSSRLVPPRIAALFRTSSMRLHQDSSDSDDKKEEEEEEEEEVYSNTLGDGMPTNPLEDSTWLANIFGYDYYLDYPSTDYEPSINPSGDVEAGETNSTTYDPVTGDRFMTAFPGPRRSPPTSTRSNSVYMTYGSPFFGPSVYDPRDRSNNGRAQRASRSASRRRRSRRSELSRRRRESKREVLEGLCQDTELDGVKHVGNSSLSKVIR